MAMLHLDLPDNLVTTLTASDVRAVREAAVVKLYDLGRISTGKAAHLLGISRRAFLDLLSQRGVPEFDGTMDVMAETTMF